MYGVPMFVWFYVIFTEQCTFKIVIIIIIIVNFDNNSNQVLLIIITGVDEVKKLRLLAIIRTIIIIRIIFCYTHYV